MTTSLRVVLGLLGLSLVALAITGSEVYSRLSYLWGVLLLGSWVWSNLSLRGIRLVRRPRFKRAHMGQVFEERYEVYNPSRLPRVWVEVRDLSNIPGSRGSHVVTLIGGRQRRSYLARSRLSQRGVFELGPTLLVSGDPFGLFPVQKEIAPRDTLLVYPLMVEVQDFPSPPGLLTGGEALRRRTHYITPNAAGVREYLPGDSLNRIHWPTTVRRDKLMVKEFELDPMADVWLFVDAEKIVHSALPHSKPDLARLLFLKDSLRPTDLPPSTEEYAASIAASLSRHFLRKRRSVGLVSCGRSLTVLPPDRGGRQLGKLLESLALWEADGEMPFSALVTAQVQHISRGSTIVLITSSVRKQIVLTVDLLVRRGLRPVVILIDSESFGGPPGTEMLAASIQAMSVPVRKVTNGGRLERALSLTP